MADPNNLDPNVKAYIERQDGDIIKADQWNDLQRCARQDIRVHGHANANDDDGTPITTDGIQDIAVTGAKIADNSITTGKIADSQITTVKIADNNITTGKIADSQITTTKIADNNITTGKIADSQVTTAKIADNNITTGKIADGQITAAKIEAGTITADQIAPGVITGGNTIDFPVYSNTIKIPYQELIYDENYYDNQRKALYNSKENSLILIWYRTDRKDNTNKSIMFAAFSLDGDTITQKVAPKSVNTVAKDHNFTGFPTTILDAEYNIHLIWAEYKSQQYFVFYRKFDSNGAQIIDSQNITDKLVLKEKYFQNPYLTYDNKGFLHLVYRSSNESDEHYWCYAKLNENGEIQNETPAFKILHNDLRGEPVGFAHLEDTLHFFTANFYQPIINFYTQFDTDGNIVTSPQPLLTFNNNKLFIIDIHTDNGTNLEATVKTSWVFAEHREPFFGVETVFLTLNLDFTFSGFTFPQLNLSVNTDHYSIRNCSQIYDGKENRYIVYPDRYQNNRLVGMKFSTSKQETGVSLTDYLKKYQYSTYIRETL